MEVFLKVSGERRKKTISVNESDPRSDVRYLGSSENKA